MTSDTHMTTSAYNPVTIQLCQLLRFNDASKRDRGCRISSCSPCCPVRGQYLVGYEAGYGAEQAFLIKGRRWSVLDYPSQAQDHDSIGDLQDVGQRV